MKEETKRRVVTALCLLLFLGVLVGGTVLFWDTLTSPVKDPAAFEEKLRSYGFVGQLIFTLLMAAQVVLAPIPGHPFEIAGGYCFGIWGGLLLTALGALVGSAVAFWLSRLLGSKAVKTFYSEEKLQKVFFLRANKSQNVLTLIAFLIPGVPKDMLAYFMGLTEMRFTTFLLISTVGRLPGILIAVLGGAAVGARDPLLIVLFFVLLVALAVPLAILYKRGKRPTENDNQKETGKEER